VTRLMAALGLLLTAAGLAACSGGDGDNRVTLRLGTHDSFAVSDAVLERFTDETGIGVQVLKGADAGTVLNRAILTKGNPEGDVLWGVDNTLLSRAVGEDVFVPYASPALSGVDPTLTALVPGHELTPVDFGDVCVNYDRAWFSAKGIAPPTGLDDLTKPAYRDLLVVQNPATSSPGLAFLLATVAAYGDPGWQAYWEALRANGVLVVDGWTQAYSTEFSGSSGNGPRPIVVSYATSPVAEVVFSDPRPAEPPTAAVTTGCFRQVEFAGVLRGTDHETEARRLVDFLLSPTFQADMPLNMFVYPAVTATPLPAEFGLVPEPGPQEPVSPDDIAANRDRWIDEWTNVVLR
jgi:thiamine transport system substrate-binding protein